AGTATNYRMFENGQPLRAFDLARLQGAAINVRKARPGEQLVTLDGQTRLLPADACVIADAGRAIAIGGIMGGRDSEVTPATTEILLEAAYFDARRTRRCRRTLGMNTDASFRFERGVDHEATAARLARAVQ